MCVCRRWNGTERWRDVRETDIERWREGGEGSGRQREDRDTAIDGERDHRDWGIE